jgi:hypothetical protein
MPDFFRKPLREGTPDALIESSLCRFSVGTELAMLFPDGQAYTPDHPASKLPLRFEPCGAAARKKSANMIALVRFQTSIAVGGVPPRHAQC